MALVGILSNDREDEKVRLLFGQLIFNDWKVERITDLSGFYLVRFKLAEHFPLFFQGRILSLSLFGKQSLSNHTHTVFSWKPFAISLFELFFSLFGFLVRSLAGQHHWPARRELEQHENAFSVATASERFKSKLNNVNIRPVLSKGAGETSSSRIFSKVCGAV